MIPPLSSIAPELELLAKGTALLASVWLLNAVLTNQNPRWRRLICRAAGCLLLFAPLLYLTDWRLPLWPADQPQPAITAPSAEYHAPLSAVPIPEPAAAEPSQALPAAPAAAKNPMPSMRTLLLGVWMAGVVANLVMLLIAWGRGIERRRLLAPARAGAVECAARVSARLGLRTAPAVAVDPRAHAPYLLGLGAPLVVLPADDEEEAAPGELDAVLAHELSHLKDNDTWWVLLLRFVRGLWWFHPLVWKMEADHERACEEVADAIAADSPEHAGFYASVLAKAALRGIDGESDVLIAPMARKRAEVLSRIHRLQERLWRESLGARAHAAVFLVAGVACAAIAAGTTSTPPEPEADSPAAVEEPAADAPAAQEPADNRYAWQAAEYRAPDPHGYFRPSGDYGARRLRELLRAVDFDNRDAEEIASTFREGFLGLNEREQQDALRSLGRTHVWSRREQDPAIVEVLFHAAPLHEGTAVYFGLSPVERKTPNLLRYLAEVAMKGEPNNTSRVLWGTKQYRSEMMELIVPYLRDDDRLRREIARAILRELEGGETYWRNNPMQREEDLPSQDEIREILANGTEKQLLRLMTSGLKEVPDDCIPLVLDLLKHPNEPVRTEAIRFASRWTWTQTPKPEVIDAMVKHQPASTTSQEFHYLVYFGLSVASPKSDAVVERLIDAALQSRDHFNTYQRIIWGLTQYSDPNPKQLSRLILARADAAKGNAWEEAALYFLHQDLFGSPPPTSWGLAESADPYLQDIAMVRISADSLSEQEVLESLAPSLPQGHALRTLRSPRDGQAFGQNLNVLVQCPNAASVLAELAKSRTDLRFIQVQPIAPRMLLDFEALGYVTKWE